MLLPTWASTCEATQLQKHKNFFVKLPVFEAYNVDFLCKILSAVKEVMK